MSTRNKLYARAKGLGYIKAWNCSTTKELRDYIIINYVNILERSEPITIQINVIERSKPIILSDYKQIDSVIAKTNIFISDIIYQIGQYLKDYVDVRSLKYTCKESYYCNYTISINSDIIPYPLKIPNHYYASIKGGYDDEDVKKLGEINNTIRRLKFKYSDKDEIVINNYTVYDVYCNSNYNKYKTIILPNSYCDEYNDTDSSRHYGGSKGTLYNILYTLSDSNTTIICDDIGVHKLFELINIKKNTHYRIDLIKERLITNLTLSEAHKNQIRQSTEYYSLYNNIKLLSFKINQYKSSLYTINLDNMKPTFKSPIKIDVSDILNDPNITIDQISDPLSV